MQVKYDLAGATLTFDLVGEPHIDAHRILELVFMYTQAFFFSTYDEERGRGVWWRSKFTLIDHTSKSD